MAHRRPGRPFLYGTPLGQDPDGHTSIVLIAGTRAPRKAGGEEYLKSVRLLKVLLDRAPGLKQCPDGDRL